MKRVVAGIHRVREILVEEEWRDAQGRLPGGMAMGAGLSAVGRGRGGGDGAPPPKVGEADVEEGDDEEGLRALQMQEELEGMEEETSGLRAQREGTGGGKTMGYVAAAPPPPQHNTQDVTQGLALVTDSFEEEALARLLASPLTVMRPGKYDSLPGGLQAPRTSRGWTIGELECCVQGSRGEIGRELARLKAVELEEGGGRFTLLGEAYTRTVLMDVCRAVRAEGWDPTAGGGGIPLDGLRAALADEHLPSIVASVTLAHSTTPPASLPLSSPYPHHVSLCPIALALTLGEGLLASAREKAEARGGSDVHNHGSIAGFLSAWQATVERAWPGSSGEAPSPIKEGLTLLPLCRSIVLVESGDTLRYFPERELPAEPSARFRALFSVRSSWREVDLLPFLEPLAHPPHRKLMDLVATYCRVTNNPDKTRLFSQR